jgi:hypothetical protein
MGTRIRRWVTIAAVMVLAALAGAAPASAADLVGNATFDSAGVRVYDEAAVGLGCTVLGWCDAATFAEVSDNATTRARSDRPGQPVVADCVVNDLVRVRMFSAAEGAGADFVLTGWASQTSVTAPVLAPC